MYGSKPGNLRRLKTTASDPKRPFARHSRDHIPGGSAPGADARALQGPQRYKTLMRQARRNRELGPRRADPPSISAFHRLEWHHLDRRLRDAKMRMAHEHLRRLIG